LTSCEGGTEDDELHHRKRIRGEATHPEVGSDNSCKRSHDDGVGRPEQRKGEVSSALGAEMGDEERLT